MTSYPPPPPGANPPPPSRAPGPQPSGALAPPSYGAPAQQPYGASPQQPYGAPAQQPYGAPAQQPYGAPAPPPAVPVATHAVNAPVVAWLVPLAALLAVIGAFTPWFRPKATVSGRSESTTNALYSFEDGRIGLLAPILLVVLAIGVVGLLVGRTPARFSKGGAHPVASAGKAAVIVGAVSLACAVVGWFLVKSQYKFPGPNGKDLGWDDFIKAAKALGVNVELSRGPQIGYFLTIAAAILAIVAGVLMILAARGSTTSTSPSGYPPAGAPQGHQPAPGGYAPAPSGYPPVGPSAGQQGPPPPSLQK